MVFQSCQWNIVDNGKNKEKYAKKNLTFQPIWQNGQAHSNTLSAYLSYLFTLANNVQGKRFIYTSEILLFAALSEAGISDIQNARQNRIQVEVLDFGF